MKDGEPEMDGSDRSSREELVVDALKAIQNLKTILLLRRNAAPDLIGRLLRIEKELEEADCDEPEADKLLQEFSLLQQEILDGVVELTPSGRMN